MAQSSSARAHVQVNNVGTLATENKDDSPNGPTRRCRAYVGVFFGVVKEWQGLATSTAERRCLAICYDIRAPVTFQQRLSER